MAERRKLGEPAPLGVSEGQVVYVSGIVLLADPQMALLEPALHYDWGRAITRGTDLMQHERYRGKGRGVVLTTRMEKAEAITLRMVGEGEGDGKDAAETRH